MSEKNETPKPEEKEADAESTRPMTPLERVRAGQAKMKGNHPSGGQAGGSTGSAGTNAQKRTLFNRKAG